MAKEELRYYQSEDHWAGRRRLLISVVLGDVIVFVGCWLAGALSAHIPVAGQFLAELQKRLASVSYFGVSIGKWSRDVLAVVVPPTIWVTSLPRRLDFLLFAGFDRELLQPIVHSTGYFLWDLPQRGPTWDVWERLSRWAAPTSIGDYLKRSCLLPWPKPPTPFQWTLLVGPSGVGKSQLALEFARYLARRQELGNSSSSAGSEALRRRRSILSGDFLRRVLGVQTSERQPWDAGLIRDDQVNNLKPWRPRRPTLLIHDDPRPGHAKTVIDLLAASADQFWYPVRLLVVDSVVPADLPITRDFDDMEWYCGRPENRFEPVSFDGEPFDDERLLRVCTVLPTAQGIGSSLEVRRRLEEGQNLQKLISATDGSPLLLGLSIEWLRATGKTVAELLSPRIRVVGAERASSAGAAGQASSRLGAQLTRRLAEDRVEDFLRAVRDEEVESEPSALTKAIASATIANGITLAFAQHHFGRSVNQVTLRRVFPAAAPQFQVVPAFVPWLLGEELLMRVLPSAYGGHTAAMVHDAWVADPVGTLDTLTSRSERFAPGFDVAKLQIPSDPAIVRACLFALMEQALFRDPHFLGHLLGIVDRQLSVDHVDEALDVLTRLVLLRHRANGLAAFAIFNVLWTRLLRDRPRASQFKDQVDLAGLHRFIDEAARCQTVSATLDTTALGTFRSLLNELLRSPIGPEDRGRLTATLDRLLACTLGNSLYFDVVRRGLLAPDGKPVNEGGFRGRVARTLEEVFTALGDEDGPNATIFRIYARTSAAEACAWKADPIACQRAIQSVDSELLDLGSSSKDVTHCRSRVWSALVAAHARSGTQSWYAGEDRESSESAKQAHLAAERVDEVASAHAADPELALWRCAAWTAVAGARSQDASRLEGNAKVVDSVVANAPDDPRLRLAQAIAWTQVAEGYSHSETHRPRVEEVAAWFQTIAEKLPKDRSSELVKAALWSHLARARSEDFTSSATTAEAATVVRAIASERHGDPEFELVAARTLTCVARAQTHRADSMPLTQQWAAMIDDIAKRFTGDADFHIERARAWRHVSFARGEIEAERPQCQRAAEVVDDAGAPFRGWYRFELERAAAWRNVTFARRFLEEESDRAEDAATVVDAIAFLYPRGLEIQRQRAWAWRHVTFARHSTVKQRPRAEEAAAVVDEIARPFDGDPELEEQRAWAWRGVALARSDLAWQRSRTEEAAAIVDQIARSRGDVLEIERARAWAWSSVAYARSSLPHERARTEESATLIDAIAARYLQDRTLELARVSAWRHVVHARSEIESERGRAEDAAVIVDGIASRFSSDLDFQDERARSWKSVAYARSYDYPDPSGATAEAATAVVEAICSPFSSALLDLVRVESWKHVTVHRSRVPAWRATAEQAARRVDEIAALYPSNRAFDCERAETWRFVTYAYSELSDSCNRAEDVARLVDRIVHPFAGDPDFVPQRAWAWAYVAGARLSLGHDVASVEQVATIAEDLCKADVISKALQYPRARAWRWIAAVRASRAKAAAAIEAAHFVDQIVSHFPDDADIALERAGTWRALAATRCETDADRARSEEAARTVDSIAADFAQDIHIQVECAKAWDTVRTAWIAARNGERAASAAKRIDEIAAQNPSNRTLSDLQRKTHSPAQPSEPERTPNDGREGSAP